MARGICHALCWRMYHTYLTVYDLSLAVDSYSVNHNIPNFITVLTKACQWIPSSSIQIPLSVNVPRQMKVC
jgi:hypothetical protein